MRSDRKDFWQVFIFSSLVVLGIVPGLTSCERDEGFGGNSSISGKIVTREYSRDMSTLLQEYDDADKNVSIIFGNSSTVGDEVETTPSGDFSFEYLLPGDYEIYCYSDDTSGSNSSGEMVVSISVSLDKNETHDLGTMYSYDLKDFNDGLAIIKGQVMMINYLSTAIPPYIESDIKDIVPTQDYEVYLIYGNHEGYDERVRTDYNGYFRFTNLIKGNYRIYTFTEDLIGGRYQDDTQQVIRYQDSEGTYNLVLFRDVSITELTQQVTLEAFYSEKE